jgi:hypothetical protein
MRLRTFSYRFAEQMLNSKLALRHEIEEILGDKTIDPSRLSRPTFNSVLRLAFVTRGWEDQPAIFHEPGDPAAKMDFLKDRVGVEVGFGHASFIGIDLLKFQVASYSGLDKIDMGVYIVTTSDFQKRMMSEFKQNWEGSLTFEKVVKYLPHFKSAIQVPSFVMGVEF